MISRILNSKKQRKTQGSAIVVTVVVFMVMTIFATIIITLFNTNLKLAKHQEDSVEAYYLAYSGIEMGFTALIADSNDLFNRIKNGTLSTLNQNNIVFENGTITITVIRSSEANYSGWIKITSTGTITNSNTSRTRRLYIDPANQKNVVWLEN